MKKIFAIVCAAFVASAAFAIDGVKVSYKNKLSSDIVNITTGDDGETSFAGIKDKSSVDFKSEKVDAGITVIVSAGKSGDKFVQSTSVDDWFIEFRPINILTLGISDLIYTNGSYLPIKDDNIANGNLGSDYVMVLRPISGLRIAAGIDNPVILAENSKLDLNFGVDYTADIFSLGATFRNVANDFGFGAYASFTGLKAFEFTAGYTYNAEDTFCDVGGNIFNLGVSFGKDALSVAADLVTNFGADENDYASLDLYTGLSVGYDITDSFGASATVTYKTEFDENIVNNIVSVEPDVTFAINKNNEIGAGVNFTFEIKGVKDSTNTTTSISFPVYWKFSL